jgi:amino acid transporter
MNYTQPYPSSVPHIILVPPSISISTLFYAASLATYIVFALAAMILMIFAIIFCLKGEEYDGLSKNAVVQD